MEYHCCLEADHKPFWTSWSVGQLHPISAVEYSLVNWYVLMSWTVKSSPEHISSAKMYGGCYDSHLSIKVTLKVLAFFSDFWVKSSHDSKESMIETSATFATLKSLSLSFIQRKQLAVEKHLSNPAVVLISDLILFLFFSFFFFLHSSSKHFFSYTFWRARFRISMTCSAGLVQLWCGQVCTPYPSSVNSNEIFTILYSNQRSDPPSEIEVQWILLKGSRNVVQKVSSSSAWHRGLRRLCKLILVVYIMLTTKNKSRGDWDKSTIQDTKETIPWVMHDLYRLKVAPKTDDVLRLQLKQEHQQLWSLYHLSFQNPYLSSFLHCTGQLVIT